MHGVLRALNGPLDPAISIGFGLVRGWPIEAGLKLSKLGCVALSPSLLHLDFMRQLLESSLVDDLFGDPVLYVDFCGEARALLL